MGEFGNDTVTLISRTEAGVEDALGVIPLVETRIDAPGCRHRTLTVKETAELNTDVATEIWKSTIPVFTYDATLKSAINAVKAIDRIEVNGQKYQVIGGVRHHPDMESNPFKVTILSQKQTG